MKKTKIVNSVITLVVPVITLITASVAWFMAKELEKDNGANGSLGLRTYFYQGDGSKDDPYEIVIPQHLYNLSRLQNFGILKDNSYYRIGHDFDGDGTYKCLKVENGVVTQEHVSYLDMGNLNSSFMSIGSEGTPFSGIFEGNNIPILNLTVDSSLEDMGLFGYCDSNSNIQDLIVSNLTVNCVGYSKEVNAIDDLYTIEVDNALRKNTVFENADLYYFDNYQNKQTMFREEKIIVGTNFNGVDSAPEAINGVNYSNSYFTPYFDTSDSRFEYDVKVSNNALKVITTDDGETQIRVDLDFINENDDFANTNCEIDTRISLVASTKYNSRKYSRVIQSYLVKIYSNRNSTTKESTGYTMSVFTDYVDPDSSSRYTNYFHGNNIGFIAGHVDGSMTNCYVYDSKINFNQGDANIFKKVDTESEIGLVGEIGVNVENTLSPEYGLADKGEIGVINFSGIYSSIRSDFPTNASQVSIRKSDTSGNNQYYVDYTKYLNQNTYQLYAEYLRTSSASTPTYITRSGQSSEGNFTPSSGSNANSVDFFGQNLIEDTPTTDRGLGIFKVATSNDRSTFNPTTYNKDTYFINGLGSSSITNGTSKKEIYYTTAENDAKEGVNVTSWVPNNGSHPNGNDYNYIENMSTVPDYADSKTFSSKYELRSNYVFKLNFGDDYSQVGNNSYFYNTDSKLLQEYFKYKLIDKYGLSIEPGNNRFGLMIRESDYTQLTSLSSYLTISSDKSIATINGQQYPANSILFEISNSNGANISVIAASNSYAASSYVSIYGYDYDSNGNLKYLDANGNLVNYPVALYSMFIPNNGQIDSMKYFNYNSVTGETDNTAVVAGDTNSSGKLFAHIFKIPKGKYFIGSPTGSINIYYMAVQGQTSGTIDEINVAQGINRVAGVDFLLCDPTTDLKKYAKLTYLAKFNTNSGTLRIYSNDEMHLLLSFTMDDKEDLSFLNSITVWNQGSFSFSINGTEHKDSTYTYPEA